MREAQHDKRIDYLELTVTDMDRAKTFFKQVFGWTYEDFGPAYCAFNDGRLDGGFALAEQPSRGGPLVVFFALDLEAMVESVKAAGGHIVKEIFSFPGGRRFHFTDPAGDGEFAVWSDR